jgi:predicted DNA-binding transcriptional regulator YafY
MTTDVMYFCYADMMRASRLLSLLMLLQTRGRRSATALARELEVSVRTVLRDIDELSAAGVPVWSDRGRDGGFQLREGWSSNLTGLTDAEAKALVLAGIPAAATELGLGTASTSAHQKTLAALPDALREDASRVSARLHIDPVAWYRAESPPLHLHAVAHAVWQQRALQIRYESWAGVRERTIQPLGLVLKAGVWYVVARVKSAERRQGARAPRTYRLSNILALTELGTTFAYPRQFHLPTFWKSATREFEATIYTGEATLRVTARGLKMVKEMSAIIQAAAVRTATTEKKTGRAPPWTRITVPIEALDQAALQLLACGPEVEVLAPAALRNRVQRLAQEVASIYQ